MDKYILFSLSIQEDDTQILFAGVKRLITLYNISTSLNEWMFKLII